MTNPIKTDTLPNWGPAQPMETAPRDGTRILALAELGSKLPQNAINGAVIVVWVPFRTISVSGPSGCWRLSPHISNRFTYLDGEPTGWWPLPEQTS